MAKKAKGKNAKTPKTSKTKIELKKKSKKNSIENIKLRARVAKESKDGSKFRKRSISTVADLKNLPQWMKAGQSRQFKNMEKRLLAKQQEIHEKQKLSSTQPKKPKQILYGGELIDPQELTNAHPQSSSEGEESNDNENDDDHLSDQDIDFFKDRLDAASSFFSSVSLETDQDAAKPISELKKKEAASVKKMRNDKGTTGIQDVSKTIEEWESEARSFQTNSSKKAAAQLKLKQKKEALKRKRLPIKDDSGNVVFRDIETNGESHDSDNDNDDKNDQELEDVVDSDEESVEEIIEGLSSEEEEEENDENEEGKDSEEEKDEVDEEVEALLYIQNRKKRLKEVRENIALLASSLLESPSENLNSHLHELAQIAKADREPALKKLAIVSMLAVFKDIIPGYRIRALSQSEQEASVSKEVLSLRKYEQGIVKHYQVFLQLLDRIIQGHKEGIRRWRRRKEQEQSSKSTSTTSTKDRAYVSSLIDKDGLLILAAKCLADLLITASHFNFRDNLVRVIIPLLDSPFDDISDLACSAVQSIFKRFLNTSNGDIVVTLVIKMSQAIKNSRFRVRRELQDTFLSLPLTEDLNSLKGHLTKAQRKAQHSVMSKKEKRDAKKRKEVEADLRLAEAEISVTEKRKYQTEIIKTIFAGYFRILKQAVPGSPLISSALVGIAHFSHLINIDFMNDLMECLKRVVGDEEGKDEGGQGFLLEDSLRATLTAFQTLKSHGEALDTDLKEFYFHFYALLLHLPSPYITELIPLAVNALELMLIENRALSLHRVASFVKRLAIVSLHCEVNGSLAFLLLTRRLFSKYPKLSQLLDGDYTAQGVYHPEIHDPDHANSFSTTLWSLSLLSHSWHPALSKYARVVATGPSLMPTESLPTSTMKMFYTYSTSSAGFNPAIPMPPPHPALKKAARKPDELVYLTLSPPTTSRPFAPGFQPSETPTDMNFSSHYQTMKEEKKAAKLERFKAIHYLHKSWTKLKSLKSSRKALKRRMKK